jgi:hypothetical protein
MRGCDTRHALTGANGALWTLRQSDWWYAAAEAMGHFQCHTRVKLSRLVTGSLSHFVR